MQNFSQEIKPIKAEMKRSERLDSMTKSPGHYPSIYSNAHNDEGGFTEIFDVIQVGAINIKDLYSDETSKCFSDFRSVFSEEDKITIKYPPQLYKECNHALLNPRAIIKPESEELLSLYLNLQSTDRQFTELIEEDIERK